MTPKLTPSDPKIDCLTPIITTVTPKWKGAFFPAIISVCTKFQVGISNAFGVMLRKPHLIFFASVTLEIEVMTATSIGFLRSICANYTPGMKLIAVKLFDFELSHGNEVSSDRRIDRRMDRWTDRQRYDIWPILWWAYNKQIISFHENEHAGVNISLT